jgi:hypothetical protein
MRRVFIILFIVVLAWAGIWYFYVRPHQKAGTTVPKIVSSFFPTPQSATSGTSTNIVNNPSAGTPTKTNPLRQLTSHPVAGYTIYSLVNTISIPAIPSTNVTTSTGTAPNSSKTVTVTPSTKNTQSPTPTVLIQSTTDHYVRYVSRESGYVYEIKNGGVATQISNIFIPNIYEAFFADGGNTAILRFLRDDGQTIATYSLPIPPANPDGTRTQVPGIYLSDNISSLSVSPDGKTLLRISSDVNGATISTSNTTGGDIKKLLRSTFSQWLGQMVGNTVYLQTKAASVANGFLYTVDPPENRLDRVIGDVPGLTTSVSPDGLYVLYSASTNTGFTTQIFNTKTDITSPINLAILPEKCAWLQNDNLICAGNLTVAPATYPDDWYAGTVHFFDQLYEIDPAAQTYSTLFDGSTASLDMTNLQVDEDQRIVYFIDKNTGFLYSYSY